MNIFLLTGFTLFLTACGGFSPEEGEWEVDRSETFSNTCGFETEDTNSNENDTFFISSTEDGGYNIDLNEDMTLDCLQKFQLLVLESTNRPLKHL